MKKSNANNFLTKKYLSVKSFSLVATAPNINTEIRYIEEVTIVADNVPIGIDR